MVKISVFSLFLRTFFQYYCLFNFNWLIVVIWFINWVLPATTSTTTSAATTMTVTTIACITTHTDMTTAGTTTISWNRSWTITRSYCHVFAPTTYNSDSLRYSITITILSSDLIYIILVFSWTSLDYLNFSCWTYIVQFYFSWT
jgi:hypothetical protein